MSLPYPQRPQGTATCIIPNCGKQAPADQPFCAEHRDRKPAAPDYTNLGFAGRDDAEARN